MPAAITASTFLLAETIRLVKRWRHVSCCCSAGRPLPIALSVDGRRDGAGVPLRRLRRLFLAPVIQPPNPPALSQDSASESLSVNHIRAVYNSRRDLGRSVHKVSPVVRK